MKSISLPDWLPSLRALSGTLGGEWERERRDTLFLMAAIGLAVLPSFAQLPLWCSAGFCVLFLWRLGLVFSGNPLPGGGIRLVTAAACTVGVIAQYRCLAACAVSGFEADGDAGTP